MLNIFSKKKATVNSTLTSTTTVEEIHAEFDKAADEILIEVNAILKKEVDKDKEIYNKLTAFGFGNSASVASLRTEKDRKSYAEDINKTVSFFKELSMDYKFITKRRLSEICKKYGLIYAFSDRYIGDIPKKNAEDILHFINQIPKDKEMYAPAEYLMYGSYKEKNWYVVGTPDMFTQERGYIDPHSLKLKDIPKDPVVLFAVHGGFMIVTKWGVEADIQEFGDNHV